MGQYELNAEKSAVHALTAVSPLDGRYASKLQGLGYYCSEAALVRYRLRVEAQWLLHLAGERHIGTELKLPPKVHAVLETWAKEPPIEAPLAVKQVEKRTNHDVKAVEYVLRDALADAGASKAVLAYVHFACTSEDINNLAYALMLSEVRRMRLLPLIDQLLKALAGMAKQHAALPMLARTHGQPASPTTLGKELAVFGHRLLRLRSQLAELTLDGKINGAVGNFNAHFVAWPEVDWPSLAAGFVEQRLGLSYNPLTTQIENHDGVVSLAQTLEHLNAVLIGLVRDVWSYISIGYFRQRKVDNEVGSSTMPHKVNPIDFENAEGNLGLANALAAHFAGKLPISRWQRDLSDSTVLRSLGSLFGYCELAWRSILVGLSKLEAAPEVLARDLAANPEVLGEAVQTVMRRHGIDDAYERLKALTRGRETQHSEIQGLIERTDELPAAVKASLKSLTADKYTGIAERLALEFAHRVASHDQRTLAGTS